MLFDFSRMFKKTRNNEIARERLKLVLIHDRANVSPQFLDMIKSEIIKVITNYMDVDEESLDIQLTRTRSESNKIVPALVANIPIKNVKGCGK